MTADDAPTDGPNSPADRLKSPAGGPKSPPGGERAADGGTAAPARGRPLRVRYGRLHAFARQALVRARLRPELASQTADALVGANLSGWDEDGVARLPEIVEGLSTRHLKADPQFREVASSGGVIVLDGDGGPGPAVAHRAMTEAITAANRHGVGAAAVRGSNRFGAPGHFARLALAHQMVGVAISNGPAAPVGAPAGPRRGSGTGSRGGEPPRTYPAALGIAVPTVETSAPLVLNLRLGSASPAPAGSGAGSDGAATASGAAGGASAEASAFAREVELALALEAVVALAGAALPGELVSEARPDPVHRGAGHLFLAFRVRAFAPWAGFRNRMVERLADLRRRRLDYPGQTAAALEEERRTRGIPLDRETAEALQRLAFHLELAAAWEQIAG